MKRKKINEVFTPRRQNVNHLMYIDRAQSEKHLYRSVIGSMHSFLSGESGSGKSWLYKKVFEEENINYLAINAANASRKGSITQELYEKCFEGGDAEKTGYKETKKAGISVVGTAELSHEAEYKVPVSDKLKLCYEKLYKQSGKKTTTIVLDNIETLFDNETLMGELSDILILLDDDDFAGFQVKFLLIAVPNNVLQYFSHAKNPTSVGNRIDELPRITGLSQRQVFDFVSRGFLKALQVNIPENFLKRISRHIYTVTLGIPQRVHEYCECLAYCIEDNGWNYNPDLLESADLNWLQKGLRECYNIVESHLNSDETTDGRRNQVIFALSRISTHQIDTQKIGVVISQDFPNSKPDSNSGIGQVLSHLCKGEKPILKKLSNSNFYVFTDPRYLMCIRLMLFIEPVSEKVKKRAFRLN
ncbi:MAG: AAA family ATPase [Oleiphilus sp.]